jgi:hypothetical protein
MDSKLLQHHHIRRAILEAYTQIFYYRSGERLGAYYKAQQPAKRGQSIVWRCKHKHSTQIHAYRCARRSRKALDFLPDLRIPVKQRVYASTHNTPRLIKAMMWVACLSEGEAKSCIRDYRAGYQKFGGCEAVEHFGGPKNVIRRAWEVRENTRIYRSDVNCGFREFLGSRAKTKES